jgi:hypothetical protein
MLTESVIQFCKKELDIPDDTLISVEYLDLSEDNVKGWAIDDADDGEYDIEIEETLSPREIIMTLCHEMVHIKQMVEGRNLDEVEAVEFEEILYNKFI